jgi:hypothetical protein
MSIIDYDIFAYSSHSASYLPVNIKYNKPHDQASRWSSGSNNQAQFITLKLSQMAIVSKFPMVCYPFCVRCCLLLFTTGLSLLLILSRASGQPCTPKVYRLKHKKLTNIDTITFGKYQKVHVCNLKEFKIYAGLDPQHLDKLVLHAGLRNDTDPETFQLKTKFSGITVPCLYLKIVPLLAHGANFNFSIWFVELQGNYSFVGIVF